MHSGRGLDLHQSSEFVVNPNVTFIYAMKGGYHTRKTDKKGAKAKKNPRYQSGHT